MKPEPSICFELSPALIAFRRTAGDANRFLNTLLVGLATLETTAPVTPKDLAVAWSKPSTASEWTETRNFALRGAMVAVVDALDRYLKIISRIDGLAAPQLDDVLNGRTGPGASHRPTLAERVRALSDHYPGVIHPTYVECVALLTAWRNRFVHSEHRGGVSLAQRKVLTSHAAFFKTSLGGADIVGALKRFDASEPPTLADLSTLIAASQRLVRDIDAHLLHLQNPETYAVEVIRYLVEGSDDPVAAVESIFFPGGAAAAGRVHALLLENGANHSENRTASAPSVSRTRLNAVLGLSRTKAAALFGITRPKTLAGQ